MKTICSICLKDDRFDPITNYCSRCTDKKVKATIFSFVTGFTTLIMGAICARVYIEFTAFKMIEECMLKSPNDASCFAVADALLIRSLAVGLIGGGILGFILGLVVFRRISNKN